MQLQLDKRIKGRKVLVMLSGGKDSCACLHLLKVNGVEVHALHFIHKWGYQLVTDEAQRICQEFQVPLTIYDYSKEFLSSLKGFTGGRPCLLCKEKMYEIALEFAIQNNMDYICIGDNANDTTTISRIKKRIEKKEGESIALNSFLDAEIKLPDNIKVIRPIVNVTSEEVLQYLDENKIRIQRVGDTGDKYFEYSREGCPVQFHDPGTEITITDMEKLCKYNTVLSEFAREKGIRASIHIPSEFIVTIPRGYEEEAKNHLIARGIKLQDKANKLPTKKNLCIVSMKNLYNEIFSDDVLSYLINRFFERLGIEFNSTSNTCLENSETRLYEGNSNSCEVWILKDKHMIIMSLVLEKKYKRNYIENLVIEVFRTNNFGLSIEEI